MKLIKIFSDRIHIKTDDYEFSGIKINDMLSVSDGNVSLATVVVSITDTESEMPVSEDEYFEIPESIKTIELAIIGSIIDGRFVKSINEYPVTDAVVNPISADEFVEMAGNSDSGCFKIGHYASYGCPAYVDGNRFFQRHACIVGNTGSGKSETVAKILQEASKLSGANIIVFDIHGEYGHFSYVENIKIGKDFPFPIWLFGLNELITNILKIRDESAVQVVSGLRKCFYKACPNGKENKPSYYSYDDLVYQMEILNTQEDMTGELYKTGTKAGTPKMVKGEYSGKLTSAINLLKDKKLDSRYSFMFSDCGGSYFSDLMQKIMNNDKPVKNIDLSDVPRDTAIIIIGLITKYIYGIQRTLPKDIINPITIVCDEAHVYIPEGTHLSPSQRRMTEIFEDIAKEGRKFGITLLVASQRPSELNKTIMAQCANFIVMKLNNENDKTMIKGMIPSGNETIIDSTTMFFPGDAVILGDCIPFPLKTTVDLAIERPMSRTINFWNIWNEGKAVDFKGAIEAYEKN